MQRELDMDAVSGTSGRQANMNVLAAVLVVSVFTLGWYWDTAASIVAIWSRSETFVHGYVVVPIVLYLVWLRRQELGRTTVKPFLPAIAGLALAGFAWLSGQISGILGLTQFMMVSMIPLAVWSIGGTALARSLLFPLLFLFFAVPFGEVVIPYLIEWTADFTVAALRLSGVPVFRDGTDFAVPSGRWSVVEACSGVRYLIASVMVGTLFAHLDFRSLKKKAIFLGAAIAVPLVANWIRAYLIVLVGHLSNNKYGVGADHVIFGWVFYGLVIFLLFWIASRWRDVDPPVSEVIARGPADGPGASPIRILVTTAAVLVVIAVWRPIGTMLEPHAAGDPIQLDTIQTDGGWTSAAGTVGAWTPQWLRPTASLARTLEKDGKRVGLYVAFYRNQSQGSELVNAGNRLAASQDHRFRVREQGVRDVRIGDAEIRVRASQVLGPGRPLVVWRWYWIDGSLTSSDYMAKAQLLRARLSMRGDDSAAIFVFAEADEDAAAADALLARFVGETGGALLRSLEQAADR